MTDDLPDPLTPADCDLRDFPYMPLDVERLCDSDLAALESPEACWAALLLWCKSYHQIPAGSLPNDDRILAKFTGYQRSPERWLAIREGALRGWIKCSDGRLYHPVVTEKANEAWRIKNTRAFEKLEDRVRKRNRARIAAGLTALEVPCLDTWLDMGRPLEKVLFPSEFSSPSAGISKTSGGTPKNSSGNGGVFQGKEHGFPAENALKGIEGNRRESKPKTIATDEVNGKPAHEVPNERAGPLSAADISVSLISWERERKKPLRHCSASHPTVTELAGMHVTADELRRAYDTAVADRQATDDPMPVNAGFIKTLVERGRNPPKPRPKRDDWDRSDEGVMRKAREVGLGQGRPGETMQSLKERVFAKVREREQEHAA